MRVKSGKQLCYELNQCKIQIPCSLMPYLVCSFYFNVVNGDPVLHSLLKCTINVKESPCLKTRCERSGLKQQDQAVSHTLQNNNFLT